MSETIDIYVNRHDSDGLTRELIDTLTPLKPKLKPVKLIPVDKKNIDGMATMGVTAFPSILDKNGALVVGISEIVDHLSKSSSQTEEAETATATSTVAEIETELEDYYDDDPFGDEL